MCLLVGFSAAGITFSNVAAWYDVLVHPPLSPPDWVFGPVWAVLYALMAVAAWLVWRQHEPWRRSRSALMFWSLQLAVNSVWTPVFFGLHEIAAGLAVILFLLAAVAVTAARFWPVNRLAGALLLPYLAWVSFAAYLNAGFWWLNR